MREYQVVPFATGVVSGNLSEKKLTDTLNQYAQDGWRLARTIQETRRWLGIFKREHHFLILERGQ